MITSMASCLTVLASPLTTLVKYIDVQKGVVVAPDSVRPRQTYWGISCFSCLFFMWGLAYGLLDIMNYHIKVILGTTRREAAYLALGYYFAYPVGSLVVGGPVLKRMGYRFGAVLGLIILASGMMLMSLGAANLTMPGMTGAHFVVGIGVSLLERTANPYAVNCGPRSGGPTRILFAQSWAAVGTIVAPILANLAIFDHTTNGQAPAHNPLNLSRCLMPAPPKGDAAQLGTVVSFYRYLGLFVYALSLALAALFYRTHLVVEIEVPRSPSSANANPNRKLWQFWHHELVSVRFSRLWYAVVANFLNLGCQVTIAQFFMEHVRVNACQSQEMSAHFMMVAQILFLVGRIVAWLLTLPFWKQTPLTRYLFKSRHVLLFFLLGAATFTAAGTLTTSSATIASICLVMFFEAPSFPMIFESATAGFEQYTPTAESIMITSIMGGGLLPLLTGLIVDHAGVSIAWVLATLCFAVVATYALACNVVPGYRRALDFEHGEVSERDAGVRVDSESRPGMRSDLTPEMRVVAPTPVADK